MKGLMIAMALVFIGTNTGAFAADKAYTFRDLNSGNPIRISMPQFKVRVDGWERDYVGISLNLKAKSPVRVSQKGNTISLAIKEFKAPWWEPAIRIRVPKSQPLSVVAGKDVWLKDCTVERISAGRAYVRDCTLLMNMKVKARWAGSWGSRNGWKAVDPE